jgi:hypothetical protein
MKPLPITAAAIATLALAACATSQAPKADGFAELRLDDTHFQVSLQGRDMSSRARVETYLLFRTAELTEKAGFDWFEMADARPRDTGVAAESPQFAAGYALTYWRPAWTFYHSPGFSPFGGPSMGAYDVTRVDSFLTTAVIAVGHGPRPEHDPRAYDAHQVTAALAARVVRPS